ncbi:MAG: polysulfide reductase NrfD [Deltaproteobacteria bacterium]|nr:polysulfide reductase NrfD [Deltaproteobacteria bacterium]MBW2214038.1 polysulfide reductase NrfD [Deltaproteobacteria bacterium]MBW2552425.1 polysulfide reductase NrfD [Deltaproteobacteria bacterium]MBW2629022.1 polysulfide reductase NrfD [Deltaproteobacteria bacterium]MBW2686462.1 polysulfide reductase NrfD [Deltaproteobacteria bacterium]
MREYTTTNSNPFIDPSHEVWAWEIPVYLFLGGLVAGMMIISGYFLLSGRWRNRDSSCYVLPALSLVLLSAGMFALFLDLEHKLYVWRLYLTFQVTSPMSWGSWILILVYPALIGSLLLALPAALRERSPGLEKLSARMQAQPSLLRLIGAINIALGIMLGIYTGILLSSLGARPLWSSALLGPLFLVSGISTAAALVDLVAKDHAERDLVSRADIGFMVTELLFIVLFLIGLMNASGVHREAAGMLLGGPFTAVFWVLVVGLGLLVPIVIQSLAATHKIRHTAVAPMLVLVGGLVFRLVMVSAGQLTHWTAT